jgi:PIN domain nuclease of toxin-antitoxin system
VLDLEGGPVALLRRETTRLILLDTNALIWLHRNHRRSKPLGRLTGRLYVSPASVLEIQFLVEAERLRFRPGATAADLAADERWLLDDPPAAAWFDRALSVGWTRDPFDRLLVAHASLRRWRLATGDDQLLERLGPSLTLAL